MGSITLDDRDGAILERLRERDASVESLAEALDCAPASLRERLPELADNGLVQRVDDDRYAITENGERAIVASPAGAMDDRIDTPADVERHLESFDLRADRAAAVRAAFAFLRYWGDATTGEIVDAVYSEHPAGFESSEAWWTECVRDRLAALPGIEPPGSTGDPPDDPGGDSVEDSSGSPSEDATDRYWRYAGPPTVEDATEDGRVAPGDDGTGDGAAGDGAPADGAPSPGSARLAIEQLELPPAQRAAVRAAFDHLVRAGEATAADLRSRSFPDDDAGYGTAEEWWADCVTPAFESLPDVEPSGNGGDRWRHRQTPEGAMSSDPGAEVPDDPADPPGGDEE